MTNNPFFSVVIPTYNRENFIQKAIDSVLNQKFSDFEIIVVDDGSTDATETVVKSILNDKIRYYKKDNGERAAARNFGAKMANGRYINFLDSDDTVYPNHLQAAKDFCLLNQGVSIFHLGYDVKDDQGMLLRSVANIRSINKAILSGNILSCNGVFIERSAMMQNQFNEDRTLSSLEDWELWVRMSARYPFLNDNTITSTIVQHDQRSVMSLDIARIKDKTKCFVHYVLQDKVNKKIFGADLNMTVASAWTYTALHLAMAKETKLEVLRYLLKGVLLYPAEIFKKRFLAIVNILARF